MRSPSSGGARRFSTSRASAGSRPTEPSANTRRTSGESPRCRRREAHRAFTRQKSLEDELREPRQRVKVADEERRERLPLDFGAALEVLQPVQVEAPDIALLGWARHVREVRDG